MMSTLHIFFEIPVDLLISVIAYLIDFGHRKMAIFKTRIRRMRTRMPRTRRIRRTWRTRRIRRIQRI